MSAAESVARVLAQRCREAGITAMILHEEEHDEKSQKVREQLFDCKPCYFTVFTICSLAVECQVNRNDSLTHDNHDCQPKQFNFG